VRDVQNNITVSGEATTRAIAQNTADDAVMRLADAWDHQQGEVQLSC